MKFSLGEGREEVKQWGSGVPIETEDQLTATDTGVNETIPWRRTCRWYSFCLIHMYTKQWNGHEKQLYCAIISYNNILYDQWLTFLLNEFRKSYIIWTAAFNLPIYSSSRHIVSFCQVTCKKSWNSTRISFEGWQTNQVVKSNPQIQVSVLW